MRGIRYYAFIFSILIFSILISGCTGNQSAGKATLQFTSSPPGAEVYLDNQYRGSTPSTLTNVEPGNYTLEYRYAGYKSWSTVITVSPGPSQYFAALSPQIDEQLVKDISGIITQKSAPAVKVTVQVSKDPMIVGDSMAFSGTGTGTTGVLLILYGPGYYSNGVILDDRKVNSAGLWEYLWNPGTSVRSGAYTIMVSDSKNTTSDRVSFNVIGGGEVTVKPSSYAASQGDTIRFSGICTSGAQNVMLVLYGPGRFAGGSELGSVSVMGDKTWSFKYALDPSMPTGVYTVNAYDIPKTTVGTSQFTIGFASSS